MSIYFAPFKFLVDITKILAPLVNPDWQICTISEGGSLRADLIVESGKGYVMADTKMAANEAMSIDMLPIDATFMPVKRVSYEVENTRVGDSIDFDKLTLEIWSNGTIDVTTAACYIAVVI